MKADSSIVTVIHNKYCNANTIRFISVVLLLKKIIFTTNKNANPTYILSVELLLSITLSVTLIKYDLTLSFEKVFIHMTLTNIHSQIQIPNKKVGMNILHSGPIKY